MRPFLAFDTATDHLALAVGDLDAPGVVIAADDFAAPRAANTVLLGAVEALLETVDLPERYDRLTRLLEEQVRQARLIRELIAHAPRNVQDN